MHCIQNWFLLQTGMVENLIKLAQAGLTDRDKAGEKMDLSGHLSSSTQVSQSVVLCCIVHCTQHRFQGSLMSAINSRISAENITSIFSEHPASDGIKYAQYTCTVDKPVFSPGP